MGQLYEGGGGNSEREGKEERTRGEEKREKKPFLLDSMTRENSENSHTNIEKKEKRENVSASTTLLRGRENSSDKNQENCKELCHT